MALPDVTYRYGDQVWKIEAVDAVLVKEAGTKKLMIMGFSHSRPWHECLNAATA